MTTEQVIERPVISAWKVRVLGGLASISGLVAAASATTDINASVGPILDSVIVLLPTIVELVVAIVPAVIVLAVVSFITGFFGNVLGRIKF